MRSRHLSEVMIRFSLFTRSKCPIFTLTHQFHPLACFPRCGFLANAAESVIEEEYYISRSPRFDSYAYARALQACIANGDQFRGKAVHCHALKIGGCLDLFCWNILLNMYAKFDLVDDACKLFGEMRERNMVSFVTLIQGHALCGQFSKAANKKKGHGCLLHLIHLNLFLNPLSFPKTISRLANLTRISLIMGRTRILGIRFPCYSLQSLFNSTSGGGLWDMGHLGFGVGLKDLDFVRL